MPAPGGAPGGRGGPGPSGKGPGGNTGGGRGGGRGGRVGGPGGGSDPGNKGPSGGGIGGGGPGRDTPGAPDAPDGKRGSTMGPNGGSATGGNRDGQQTPGDPRNNRRQGQNEDGSTPASRARDAMSRHQKERDRRSIENGGLVIGDNDENAGLGLTHAMDSQQTENALNRSGVTDTLGMSEVDRMGLARKAGSMLSSTDRQKERGIRHGFDSQFAADRVSDITGLPGIATDAAVSMFGRPKNTMQTDVNIGRERAKDKNIGAVGEMGLSLGLGIPGNMANFGAAIAGAAMDSNMAALASSDAPGQSAPTGQNGRTDRGTPSAARAAMSAPSPAPKAQPFSWNPVDMTKYNRGLLSLAQSS